jgi:hypothetical protein
VHGSKLRHEQAVGNVNVFFFFSNHFFPQSYVELWACVTFPLKFLLTVQVVNYRNVRYFPVKVRR